MMEFYHGSHYQSSIFYHSKDIHYYAIKFLLKARDVVEPLKFLPGLPHTQVSPIIRTDEISYAILRQQRQQQN